MIVRPILVPLVSIGLSVATWSQTGPSQDTRVRSYALEVAFEPENSAMTARAEIAFAPLDREVERLVFYLHDELRVTSARIGGEAVGVEQERSDYFYNYSLAANRVEIALGELDPSKGLIVEYTGHFRPSEARSPSDYMRIDTEGVFLRAYQYSLWFPVFLPDRSDPHAVDFDPVVIDTPARYLSVFAGTRIASREIGARRITEWRAEDLELNHAQCTAQPFELLHDASTFVYSLQDAESREVADGILTFAKELDAVYRRQYQPQGADRQLHVLQMPRYGDISSDNVLGLSSENWTAFGNSIDSRVTLAHELVHSTVWVPTPRSDPLYALVIEGFPAYFHLPALDEILGGGFYSESMKATEERYLARKRTGRGLPPEKPLVAITADEVGVYKDRFVLNDRALLFLNDLRSRLGEDRFGVFTRDLLTRENLGSESFSDLIAKHLPGYRERLRLWLETTEYPDTLRLQSRQR